MNQRALAIVTLCGLSVAAATMLIAAQAEPADEAKLDALYQERISVGEGLVKAQELLNEMGRGSAGDLWEAKLQVMKYKLDSADTKAQRIALLEQIVEQYQQAYEQAEKGLDMGVRDGAGVQRKKLEWLDWQIKLEKERLSDD